MSSLLFYGVVVLLGLLAIRFLIKSFFKLALLLLAVIGVLVWMYYLGIGPFKTNVLSLAVMEAQFCKDTTWVATCNCQLAQVRQDLEKRFSPEELEALQQDRLKWSYALYRSYETREAQINECLESYPERDYKAYFLEKLIPKEEISETVRSELEDDYLQ